MIDTIETPVVTRGRTRLAIGEDWLAVLLGGLSIALALTGVRPSLPSFAWTSPAALPDTVFGPQNLVHMLVIGGGLGAFASAGLLLTNDSIARFMIGFPVVFGLACASLFVAGNVTVAAWGFEYVIFAFLLGLAISNFGRVPRWVTAAVRTEYFIKIGLVILGASIVFGDLLRAGMLGMAQALLVVTVVWFVCFHLARRLKVDDEFATILASAVSICGVSAAIAACGAIQGDRKKLSYVTSLVLIVSAPMMVIMPHIIRAFETPDVVGGAWLGGTLDTSASVVAAGEMISRAARDAGVVVKLSQNVLIGVAAFLLTVWWTLKNREDVRERPSARVIWERFPKFVLGFIAASFVMSFVVSGEQVTATRELLTGLRTFWFALAFVSIGLETRFMDLATAEGGRPALAFLGGQAFNVFWTLLLAYALFGGMFFDVPAF
jgi:uncharacterized integral membrane protein (TIGR00698 family)